MSTADETAVAFREPARGGIRREYRRRTRPPLASDEFQHDEALPRLFFWAMLFWGSLCAAAAALLALQLAVPPRVSFPELSFGRLSRVQDHLALLGLAANALFCGVYYATPRLCRTRIFSPLLGRAHFWTWQAIVLAGAATLPLGLTSGSQASALIWPIRLAITAVWAGLLGANFFGTLARRRERRLYPSIWFFTACIVAVAILNVLGSLWLPAGLVEWFRTGAMPAPEVLLATYPLHAGLQDAFLQLCQGQGQSAFLLGAGFMGLMYYILPKAANRPVFSANLTIVHFWSFVLLSVWAVPSHLHFTSLPDWASVLGTVFGLILWLPAMAGVANGLLTLRAAGRRAWSDPALRFLGAAIVFYALSATESALLSAKPVSQFVQYTELAQAPAHSLMVGWVGSLVFAMAYWLSPRLLQSGRLFSVRLAAAHFWLAMSGTAITIVAMYGAGATQAALWHGLDPAGNLVHPDFTQTLGELVPFRWIAAAGGALSALGSLGGAFNLLMTWRLGPKAYNRPVEHAPRLDRRWTPEATRPSRLSESNTRFAQAGDRWLQGDWHRNLESRGRRLATWIVIVLASATLAQLAPTLLIPSNIPAIASVQPYTPLELAGRDIYISEGCQACHTQQIRPILAEIKRYGEHSRAGEFVYDHPALWGSRRIGPDLARQGGQRTDLWHLMHFVWPRDAAPDSTMPSYWHLLNQRADFDALAPRVRAMDTLGVPFGDPASTSPDRARAQALQIAGAAIEQAGGLTALQGSLADAASIQDQQDLSERRIIALIAYLQRLGVDFSKAPIQDEANAGGAQ